MSAIKLTPWEALQRRKFRLQVKSDALEYAIEDNFEYLKDNLGALAGEAVTDAVVSKMPPFVQQLIHTGQDVREYGLGASYSLLGDIAAKASDLVPFFMKGKKAIIFSLILKQLKRFLH